VVHIYIIYVLQHGSKFPSHVDLVFSWAALSYAASNAQRLIIYSQVFIHKSQRLDTVIYKRTNLYTVLTAAPSDRSSPPNLGPRHEEPTGADRPSGHPACSPAVPHPDDCPRKRRRLRERGCKRWGCEDREDETRTYPALLKQESQPG